MDTTPPDTTTKALAALASAWDDNAAEERRTLRYPNVTVDEAHTCEPVARTWEEAARELRAVLTAGGAQ